MSPSPFFVIYSNQVADTLKEAEKKKQKSTDRSFMRHQYFLLISELIHSIKDNQVYFPVTVGFDKAKQEIHIYEG